MTHIHSSLTAYSGISSISALSANQSIYQLGSAQPQATTSTNASSTDSVDLSDEALGMLSGSGLSADSGSDSSDDALAALTYSNFSGTTQDGISSLEALLGNYTNTTDGTSSENSTLEAFLSNGMSSDDGSSFAETALADGGPLPAFLAQVDTQLHLNSTQQQALQSIANQYQNADDTPDTVQSIAAALQQANI